VLVSGGHHLIVVVGYDIFYRISYDILIAILLNKPVVLLSQTIGPFNTSNNKKINLISYILTNCKHIAIRDNNSLNFINQFNIDKTKISIIPDMVYGLYNLLNESSKPIFPKSIGVALYGNYPGEEGKNKVKKYINHLVSFFNILDTEFQVNLIPMEVKGTDSDDRVLMDYIIENTSKNLKIQILEDDGDIINTIKNFKQNELIIAFKTHSVLFSLLQSIPVIAVAYHQKSIDFMEMYGLKDYSFWDKEINKDILMNKFLDAYNNRKEISIIEYSNSLKQYSKLNEFIHQMIFS